MPYEVRKEFKSGGVMLPIGRMVDDDVASPNMIEKFLENGTLKKVYDKKELSRTMIPYKDQNNEEHMVQLNEFQVQQIFRILQTNPKKSIFIEMVEEIGDMDMLAVLDSSDERMAAKPFYQTRGKQILKGKKEEKGAVHVRPD